MIIAALVPTNADLSSPFAQVYQANVVHVAVIVIRLIILLRGTQPHSLSMARICSHTRAHSDMRRWRLVLALEMTFKECSPRLKTDAIVLRPSLER